MISRIKSLAWRFKLLASRIKLLAFRIKPLASRSKRGAFPGLRYPPATMDRARYQQEAQRLAAILRGEIQRQGVSIRSLEQKMGVGNSVYQKVLGGKISMTLGHLLQMADALGLEWSELFRMAYHPGPAQSPGTPAAEED